LKRNCEEMERNANMHSLTRQMRMTECQMKRLGGPRLKLRWRNGKDSDLSVGGLNGGTLHANTLHGRNQRQTDDGQWALNFTAAAKDARRQRG
jgi:hypothetical protein